MSSKAKKKQTLTYFSTALYLTHSMNVKSGSERENCIISFHQDVTLCAIVQILADHEINTL